MKNLPQFVGLVLFLYVSGLAKSGKFLNFRKKMHKIFKYLSQISFAIILSILRYHGNLTSIMEV